MRLIISICFIYIFNTSYANAQAGSLAYNVKIKQIDVGPNNEEDFSMFFDSTKGSCKHVSFIEPNVTTARWKAALSIATAAMLSNKSIQVYSHTDVNDCISATWIRIIK